MRVERVEKLFGNRQEDEAMYKHILIPTDGSELSNMAIRHGVALAKAVNAKITGIPVTTPFHVIAMDPETPRLVTSSSPTDLTIRQPASRHRKIKTLQFAYFLGQSCPLHA